MYKGVVMTRTMGTRNKLTIATVARIRNLLVARMNQVAVWKRKAALRRWRRWSPIKTTPLFITRGNTVGATVIVAHVVITDKVL
jgi:hypothetical protein